MDTQHNEPRQVMRYFTQSLYRASAGLALIPMSLLPPGAQQHFKASGHEFTRGVAKLAHGLANGLDEKVKEEK
ncbi:MAG: hypothetical protein M3Y81_24065 [Chloroflexota bacterium]|nr:hypothetical protein [Chloroflexota bacterium]